jgi:uncharacterized membrane protein YdfJ with MMPL/SSD domain
MTPETLKQMLYVLGMTLLVVLCVVVFCAGVYFLIWMLGKLESLATESKPVKSRLKLRSYAPSLDNFWSGSTYTYINLPEEKKIDSDEDINDTYQKSLDAFEKSFESYNKSLEKYPKEIQDSYKDMLKDTLHNLRNIKLKEDK